VVQASLHLCQNPALRLVVLEVPNHNIEIALLDLVSIKKVQADGVLESDDQYICELMLSCANIYQRSL
jgi:hypothetical protein